MDHSETNFLRCHVEVPYVTCPYEIIGILRPQYLCPIFVGSVVNANLYCQNADSGKQRLGRGDYEYDEYDFNKGQ